eukprot:CAMPEP_0179869554 /NCGR_PEP_ID=MMETSP0982-20121206/19611_1 /TAXON_ID=483367 /ORGANISM="non described non described, Strain CCMP 2436" /LENGTH=259 /DNA_ID=CAMNT_0021759679 /DNA_START=183 /DNA_END=962 /DNA_ORIENTATION=+
MTRQSATRGSQRWGASRPRACTRAACLSAQLVVASPMRRTLETAQLAVPAMAGGKRLAMPLLQEIGCSNADTGRPPDELRAEFGSSFDFSECEDMWFVKPAPWCKQRRISIESGLGALVERQGAFVKWIAARPEPRIVVITHHGFVCHLLGVVLANCEIAAMELTPSLTWVEQRSEPSRLPIFGVDRTAMTHKGSAPLRATSATIGRHYGKSVLVASERNANPLAAKGWPLAKRRLLLLQAAALAGIVTLALWRLVRKA